MRSNPERKPLTEEETEWASYLGMTPEDYADLKTIRNINDWNEYVERKAQADDAAA